MKAQETKKKKQTKKTTSAKTKKPEVKKKETTKKTAKKTIKKEQIKEKIETNKSKKKLVITIVIICIFVLIMIISGIKIAEWFDDNRKSKEIIDDVKEAITIDESKDNIEKYNVNFEELKQKNSDVKVWFKVNGTEIEYPAVQSSDNDYYMNHSYDKSYNGAGWIFIDYKDKLDGSDKNIVMYGHNRKDGSMFGTLKNILEDEWQNNPDNYIIPFITENEKVEYQVFSVYRVEKEDYYITTNFNSTEKFQAFIDKIKSRSYHDFNVDVTTDDTILTLSTCADNNQYRVVLHAKKIVK
jgi:sortase B